jgi:hypothetical protein
MPLGRRVVPYLLLGALTFGAGLGVGLGLSEGPVTNNATATSSWAPCATARTASGTTVTCGTVVSDVTPSSFTYDRQGAAHFYESPPKMPRDFATCMTSALIHVVPRATTISSGELNRKINAIYMTCSGLKDRL